MSIEYFDKDIESYLFKRKGSSAFRLDYHIVFSTKYRRSILKNQVGEYLRDVLIQVCVERGYHLLGLDIQPDHVHILIGLRPSDHLARVVQILKGRSSYEIFKRFPELPQKLIKRALWSEGYSVDSLGWKNIAQIKAYLDQQDDHHKKGPTKVGPSGLRT